MDTDAKAFDADFYAFRCVIRELERRLAAIIVQAFDDCTTIASTFKLLDSFEGLLDREVIAVHLEKKHIDLLYSYASDLKDVADLFAAHKARPVVARNSAPHSGAVAWVRGLVERIEEPLTKLRGLGHGLMDSDAGRDIERTYDALIAAMREYEGGQVALYCARVADTSEDKLNQALLAPLLGGLGVNFDPELVRLLRETKYFLLLKIEVPASAAAIFSRADLYRQQISSLELICSTWNRIQRTILPVERPLVSEKLAEVEVALRRGQNELNWKVRWVAWRGAMRALHACAPSCALC
jgi:dynein heavy chain, axonemal